MNLLRRIRNDGNFRNEGERRGAEILSRLGHVLVCHNYHVRFAEIDLITICGDFVHYVEVKNFTCSTAVHPLETLTGHKIKKMRLASACFVRDCEQMSLLLKAKNTVSKELIPYIVSLQPSFDLLWVKKDEDFEYFQSLF